MVEPDHFLEAALLEAATEAGSGLTPAAFKSLSKSVADLSTLSPDLMKSTGDLMTGRVASRMFKRKMGQIKSSSQQSLIPGSAASSVDDLPSAMQHVRGDFCCVGDWCWFHSPAGDGWLYLCALKSGQTLMILVSGFFLAVL